jgi:hypothetical protein
MVFKGRKKTPGMKEKNNDKIIFVFLSVLGLELRALQLLGRHLNHLNNAPSPFCLSHFSGGVSCFCPNKPGP